MHQRITGCAPAISIGVFAAILALGSSRPLAASDCIERPRPPEAQDGHWYYRVDQATGHRCWHLGAEPAAIAPPVETAPQPPQPGTVRLLSSLFSSLFPTGSTPQPDTVSRDRAAQPEPRGEDTPKRRRQAQAKPASEPKAKPGVALDQAARDALFQEYLRWREEQ